MRTVLTEKIDCGDKSISGQIISLEDKIVPKGRVRAFIEENGNRWLAWDDPNLIVNGARKALAHLVALPTDDYRIHKIGLGTGGHVAGDIITPISPSVADLGLETQAFEKVITEYTFEPIGVETSVKFTVSLGRDEGNGSGVVAYTEAGLFCVNGTMFARETFPALVKNSNRRIIFEWSLLF